MSPEETELSRALVALPGWEWKPGMLAHMPASGRYPACNCRIVGDAPFPGISGYVGRLGLVGLDLSAVPDLHDPATAGALLAMLHALPGMVWVRVVTKPYQPNTRVEWKFEKQDSSGLQADHLGVALARALVAIGRCA